MIQHIRIVKFNSGEPFSEPIHPKFLKEGDFVFIMGILFQVENSKRKFRWIPEGIPYNITNGVKCQSKAQ